MIISYGNNDDSLTRKEVTKNELTDIIQSNEIVNLLRVENHEIDENGFFDVQNGLTSIGNGAFLDCSSLTGIILPEGITNIGRRAFALCSSLTTIRLSKGLTNIGNCAFHGCSSLTTITLPEGITYIANYAFSGCSSLTTINLPEGITDIGICAFLDCFSLTTITLPGTLTNIGSEAFSNCPSLINISLPEGLTSIEDGAFFNCSSLATITLPEGITNIGHYAFCGCPNLQTLIIDGDENEVERVKALLPVHAFFPEEARDKVILISTYEALLVQKEAIIELAATPQFSSLYEGQAFLKVMLPDSILGEINSYLTDDKTLHPLFQRGRQEIERIPLSLFFTNPERFSSELVEVKNNYRALAEKNIKPSIKWQFYDAKNETSMQEEKTNAAVTKKP